MNEQPFALTSVPTNLNFLSPLGFKFIMKRCPTVNYFLHRINIPGITLEMVEEPTPFVNIPIEGDHGKFNNLIATFQVDEDLKNWLEIHSWIRNLAKMDDFAQHKSLSKNPEWTGLGLTSEIILTILNSAREPNFSFVFHGCLPMSLSDLVFDSKLSDVKYLISTVEFRYMNYDYEKVL
jgi:hypothetical protein